MHFAQRSDHVVRYNTTKYIFSQIYPATKQRYISCCHAKLPWALACQGRGTLRGVGQAQVRGDQHRLHLHDHLPATIYSSGVVNKYNE